jgi:fumarate reductase flavoprotein subunit
MKIERTWFAADKTGFHMLHTLFQTSPKYPGIVRLDEHFCIELLVHEGRVAGVVAIDTARGEFRLVRAKAVIVATPAGLRPRARRAPAAQQGDGTRPARTG